MSEKIILHDTDLEPHLESCPHFFKRWSEECNCNMEWRTIKKWKAKFEKSQKLLNEFLNHFTVREVDDLIFIDAKPDGPFRKIKDSEWLAMSELNEENEKLKRLECTNKIKEVSIDIKSINPDKGIRVFGKIIGESEDGILLCEGDFNIDPFKELETAIEKALEENRK